MFVLSSNTHNTSVNRTCLRPAGYFGDNKSLIRWPVRYAMSINAQIIFPDFVRFPSLP